MSHVSNKAGVFDFPDRDVDTWGAESAFVLFLFAWLARTRSFRPRGVAGALISGSGAPSNGSPRRAWFNRALPR